jgi:hypothetical protein
VDNLKIKTVHITLFFKTVRVTKFNVVLGLCKLGALSLHLQEAKLCHLVMGWKCGLESSKVPFWDGSHL